MSPFLRARLEILVVAAIVVRGPRAGYRLVFVERLAHAIREGRTRPNRVEDTDAAAGCRGRCRL